MKRSLAGIPLRNWNDLARISGYKNERDMLERLYFELPLHKLSERLNCAHNTVLYHLRKHGIMRRPKGRPGLPKPKPVSYSMHVDDWRRMNEPENE
jgi:hypothetical protein